MNHIKRFTFHESKKNKRQKHRRPTAQALAALEANAVHALMARPKLPQSEMVADQMIKGLNFKIKTHAALYALLWLTIVPAVPAAIAAFISILSGCDTVIVIAWFAVVFGPLFIFKGVMGNVQKRLYVTYCLGFRGAKAALTMGWDGHEYTPYFSPYYWRRY